MRAQSDQWIREISYIHNTGDENADSQVGGGGGDGGDGGDDDFDDDDDDDDDVVVVVVADNDRKLFRHEDFDTSFEEWTLHYAE